MEECLSWTRVEMTVDSETFRALPKLVRKIKLFISRRKLVLYLMKFLKIF